MRKLLPVIAVAAFVLAACSGEQEPDWAAQAEEMCLEAVANKMKDPNSTEFRDVTVEHGGDAATMDFQNKDGSTDKDVEGEYWEVHGEVNAKNGFGAMVGFREFECNANKYDGRDMKTGYINIARR